MDNRKIEIIQTKEVFSGEILKTIKVDNIYLHSRYYPLKEAYEIVENLELKGKKNILIYGIGAGYHVFQILKTNKDADLRIKVFDLEKECFNLIKEDFIIKEILKDSRVQLVIDDFNKDFLNKFLKALDESEYMYIYKPSLKIVSSENELKKVLLEYEAQRCAEKIFSHEIEQNLIINEGLDVKDINAFFNDYNLKGKTVIIASAGPSLDMCMEDMKVLKNNKKDIFIIAVGTSLRPLMIKGIEPDMFCILDPHELIYEQIKGYENINVPMCFLASAAHKAVSNFNGPKYIFYNYVNKSNIIIECGNSVATAAISIAIKGEAKNIVLVGQDLAFIQEKRHSDNTMHGMKEKYDENQNNLEVMGVNGNIVKTTKFYISIKQWIEKVIKYNPEIRFINCSKGARIEGAQEITLEQLTALYVPDLREMRGV